MLHAPSVGSEVRDLHQESRLPTALRARWRSLLFVLATLPATATVQGQEGQSTEESKITNYAPDRENGNRLLYTGDYIYREDTRDFELSAALRKRLEAYPSPPMSTLTYEKAPKKDSPGLTFHVTEQGNAIVRKLSDHWDNPNETREMDWNEPRNIPDGESALIDDIVKSRGSAFCVDGRFGSYIFTNWHVGDNTHQDIEEHMSCVFSADIAVVPVSSVLTSNDGKDLPRVRLPHSSVNNKTLHILDVQMHGWGTDLYTVSGKPVPFVMAYGKSDQWKGVEMFALLVPEAEIKERYQFRGTSGSPVTIKNTGEVVGITHSASVIDGKMHIIFSGPDHIRAAYAVAETQQESRYQMQRAVPGVFVGQPQANYFPINQR